MMKKILIVDDHTMIRDTWAHLINTREGFEVVGKSRTAEEGIETAKMVRPDILLLDINLPGMNGIDATKLFKKFVPAIKIIGVSMHNQVGFVKQMMKNGALGYLTKTSPIEELFLGINEVLQGKKYICQEVRDIIAQQMLDNDSVAVGLLSRREVEVIRLLKEGHSSKEMAVMLHISTKTVEVHRYNILRKLKLKNTAALVQFYNSNPNLFTE